MRSVRVEDVEDGTTIRTFLEHLAKRYFPIARSVFDIQGQKIYPEVVMNYNDRVVNPDRMYDRILKNGDRITILPLAGGG
jgi:sulfur carrier protein ThiS